MADDLITRLRNHLGTAHVNETEAADEIERLRAALRLACTPPFKAGGTLGVCDETLMAYYMRNAAGGKGDGTAI